MFNFLSAGCLGHPPLHEDFELVERQHLLPHDDRQFGPRIEAALRDVPGVQDGRLAHFLHLSHADEHEQAEIDASQVMKTKPRAVSRFGNRDNFGVGSSGMIFYRFVTYERAVIMMLNDNE